MLFSLTRISGPYWPNDILAPAGSFPTSQTICLALLASFILLVKEIQRIVLPIVLVSQCLSVPVSQCLCFHVPVFYFPTTLALGGLEICTGGTESRKGGDLETHNYIGGKGDGETHKFFQRINQ